MWHPGSSYDSHLILLTSDNTLRTFNMDLAEESGTDPEHTWHLADSALVDGTSQKRFFGDSALTLKGSLGETAVSFAFAPSVGVGVTDENPHLWPLFILCGDGSVFCMMTTMNKVQKPKLMGPLSMYPESNDNYGTDACSILCLHPKISSPPILVIATNRGILYHCIVLQKLEGEGTDDASQVSDWSAMTQNQVDLALHVYESVELELSLLASENPEVQGLTVMFDKVHLVQFLLSGTFRISAFATYGSNLPKPLFLCSQCWCALCYTSNGCSTCRTCSKTR